MKKTTKNQVELLPLFQQFINASHKGCHRKQNGTKISKGNVENYENTVVCYSSFARSKLLTCAYGFLCALTNANSLPKKNYWKNFTASLPFTFTTTLACTCPCPYQVMVMVFTLVNPVPLLLFYKT